MPDTLSACREAFRDKSMSSSIVSEMGCPEVGKDAIGSIVAGGMPAALCYGSTTTMAGSACSLPGESMHSCDLIGLLVEGLEAPDDVPLLLGSRSGPWLLERAP